MKLTLYLARRMLRSLAIVLGAVGAIVLLVAVAEELARLAGDPSRSLGAALRLAALNLPMALYRTLPLTMLLAGIHAMSGLSRSAELVAMRAAGLAPGRILAGPMLVALATGLVALTILNPLATATAERYERLRRGETDTLAVSESGIWLRQLAEDGPVVLRARRADARGQRLHDVSLVGLDERGLARWRIEAEEVTAVPGGWQVLRGRRWDLLAPRPAPRPADGAMVRLRSAPGIRDVLRDPERVPIYELPGLIARLRAAGLAVASYELALHAELALPLVLVAMLLLGAGASMGPVRLAATGPRLLLALLLGFGFHFARNIVGALAEGGQVAPMLAAWVPVLSGLALAAGVLMLLEEG